MKSLIKQVNKTTRCLLYFYLKMNSNKMTMKGKWNKVITGTVDYTQIHSMHFTIPFQTVFRIIKPYNLIPPI